MGVWGAKPPEEKFSWDTATFKVRWLKTLKIPPLLSGQNTFEGGVFLALPTDHKFLIFVMFLERKKMPVAYKSVSKILLDTGNVFKRSNLPWK